MRWLAAILIWVMLITSVLASTWSARVAGRASLVSSAAMTTIKENEAMKVREVARAYAVEWGTWNGNAEDYRRRLAVFIKKAGNSNVTAPEGIQRVTSASVQDIKHVGENNYRVKVLMHVQRITPYAPSEIQSLPQVLIPVTRDDLNKTKQEPLYAQSDNKTVPVWCDKLLCVEVPVRISTDGYAGIAGLPVIISPGQGQGEIIDQQRLSETPTNEFKTFVNQFFGLYYSGGALANFLDPDTVIEPLNGWELESVGEIYVDSKINPSVASVRLSISSPGIQRLEQKVYMKIHSERGNYLIKEILSSLNH